MGKLHGTSNPRVCEESFIRTQPYSLDTHGLGLLLHLTGGSQEVVAAEAVWPTKPKTLLLP